MFSQTFQSKDSKVPLLMNGNLEELGTFKDLVYKNETRRKITFGIEFEEKLNGGISTKEKVRSGYFEVELKFRPNRREIVVERTETQVPIGVIRLKTKLLSTGNHKYFFYDAKGNDVSDKIKGGKRRLLHCVPYYLPGEKISDKLFELIYAPFNFNFAWSDFFENNLEYICPFRDLPKRTYLFSGERPDSVGIHGDKAIELMAMDHLTKEKPKIIDSVSKWLNRCDISSSIKVVPLTDRHYEIKLTHPETGESENLADVGFGCSQILPILIAGYNLKSGQTLSVEEPEIHLHPKAQAELGSFFYDLAKIDVQTLIETHSEHLLLRIQSHIANGDLNPEDVRLYYVFANKEKKKKDIKEINLNERGEFLTEWPEGFFPERLDEVKKIAKAALKRR